MTDTGATWTVGQFVGAVVTMGGSTATVTSNTATVLTFSAWAPTGPTTGAYTISFPCNGDANQDVGEVVTTIVKTGLVANGGSFYDSPETRYTGVTLEAYGNVPVGDTVGSGTFTIHVGDDTCSSASASIGPAYTIYNGLKNPPLTPYPVGGYAGGTTPAELAAWDATGFGQNWVADFDDDNHNNVPDYNEVNTGDTLAETVEDKFNDATNTWTAYTTPPAAAEAADGILDGAQLEPLYLPDFDLQITGATHTHRAIGNAVVAPGTLEVPVDFVSYVGFPAAGTTTQAAVIQEGSGAGLLPGNPASSGTVTCPSFTSAITTFGASGTGVAVQRMTASGDFKFASSTAADFDGDGKANYNDNCDAVANSSQADADLDKIGDPCDSDDANPVNLTGTASASDATSMTRAGAGWTVGQFIGATVTMGGSTAVITSNTATVLTFSAWAPLGPTTGAYTITKVDFDQDGFANANDSCPESAVQNDNDDDGISDGCDPDDTVDGDGNGYGFATAWGTTGPLGSYDDHDSIDTDSFTAGANEGLNDAVVGPMLDSDDDHTPDALPDLNGDDQPDDFDLSDSDGDGWPDACETGYLLYGPTGGSDALQAASVPNAAAIQAALGSPNLPTGADCDGDGTANATDTAILSLSPMYDSDGDGCKDSAETARLPKTGDPNNQWDFYSVPSPALLAGTPSTADMGIGITTDVVALLKYAGKSQGSAEYDKDVDINGIPDGRQYDRSALVLYGGSWPGPPDGGIGITTDVVAMLAQAGFTCAP